MASRSTDRRTWRGPLVRQRMATAGNINPLVKMKSACRMPAGGFFGIATRYCEAAVLVVMLTTWTRRLAGSVGAVGILRLGLAITDGDEIGAVDAVLLGEVALDRIGATLGEALVVFFTADRIGMAGDDEGRTLQARSRERFAEFLHRRHRVLADVGRVVIETDLQIDFRLGRGEFRDLFALAERERAGLAVAQG